MEEGCWNRYKILGTGAFGVVELWRNDYNGNMIAIKKYRGDFSKLTEKHRARWISEVETMKSLRHPNIVETRRVPSQLENMDGGFPFLCMEYCSLGDLRSLLNQSENCCGIEETEALKIMRDISSAVEYLHSRSLVHRDLKPENIVLQGIKEQTVYKLTDFGYVRELGQESLDASVVGTLNYLAPELLTNPTYNCTVDYWSLGILFYEVITGNRPLLPNMPITATWMRHIEKKKYQDIRARGGSGNVVAFSTDIETPTTISDCMRDHLTDWFRVALQWDPKRRGKKEGGHELVIFSLLKSILQARIVKVFVAPLYRIDSYAVYPNISVQAMQNLIHARTKIEIVHQTLTDHQGYPINQTDVPLFRCIEKPQLVLFQRDKIHVEDPPRPNVSPPVQQMIDNPLDTVNYETTRRYYAATLLFIKQEYDLFKFYVIALSIKIDLSNMSLEYLRKSVQVLMIGADSLMNELNYDTQLLEHGSMCVELKEAFDTIVGKTQKLLEGAQEVSSKLDVLSGNFEQLKVFSNSDWLDNWTQLHEKATCIYENSLKRNPGQRESTVNMARLVYSALKLHGQQLRTPKIEAFLNDVTYLDTNILQLQESLNSFEALVDLYRRNLKEILTRRAAETPTTCQTLTVPMTQNDIAIFDNIMVSKLIDRVLEDFEDPLMDLNDLEFNNFNSYEDS